MGCLNSGIQTLVLYHQSVAFKRVKVTCWLLEINLWCMVAEVRSDGCRRGCFSGCRGADEWLRLYTKGPTHITPTFFTLIQFQTLSCRIYMVYNCVHSLQLFHALKPLYPCKWKDVCLHCLCISISICKIYCKLFVEFKSQLIKLASFATIFFQKKFDFFDIPAKNKTKEIVTQSKFKTQ